MPFISPTLEGSQIRRSRMLWYGGPGSGKTTSVLTCPKPIKVISSPGEKGYDSIPVNDPEIQSFVWEEKEGGKETDSHQIVLEIERLIGEIIVGKHGPVNTLVFEGLHKFGEYILDAVTAGAYFDGKDFEYFKIAPRAKRWMFGILDRMMHSKIPVVITTCWGEYEADRQKKPGEDAASYNLVGKHIYPMLTGKLAKEIIGEFSVVAYQSRRKEAGKEEYMWQLKPEGEVWGCGVKGPKEMTLKLPTYVRATYGDLTKVLEEASK